MSVLRQTTLEVKTWMSNYIPKKTGYNNLSMLEGQFISKGPLYPVCLNRGPFSIHRGTDEICYFKNIIKFVVVLDDWNPMLKSFSLKWCWYVFKECIDGGFNRADCGFAYSHEKRCYFVTTSLIGWAQALNQHCLRLIDFDGCGLHMKVMPVILLTNW